MIDMNKQYNGITLTQLAAQIDDTCSKIVGAELSRGDLARMIVSMIGKTPTWAVYSEVRESVVTTDDRSMTWNNALKTLKADFQFVIPDNDSPEATKKAAQRAEKEKAARELLASKFNGKRPDSEALREAAIAKETASDKNERAAAALVLQAAKVFDADQASAEKDVREKVLALIKTANLRHLELALKALETAIPENATVEIKVTTKKK